MAKIYYVAQYACKEIEAENRQYSLAGAQKVETIAGALEELGHEVEIVTYGRTKNRFKWVAGTRTKISEKVSLRTFLSIGLPFPLYKLDGVFQLIQMFFYLICTLKQNDILLAYHSLLTTALLLRIKRICKCVLIYEVEEIYQNISQQEKKKEREIQLLKYADGYILSTELLKQRLAIHTKPTAVIYGKYVLAPRRVAQETDGRIHCIYAGTFEGVKGGAIAAIESAPFLPQSFCVHIAGFGTRKETESLLQLIEKANQENGARVIFEGMKKGDDYIFVLQKCHIGLNTQIPNAAYAESSFPSKVLSYLANGLRVVSSPLKVLEITPLNKEIYYYAKQSGKEIAQAIQKVDIEKTYDTAKLFESLHQKMLADLQSLICCVIKE